MKKIGIGFIFCIAAINAVASDERIASKIVKKYSETVACQISDIQTQKNQYKAVTAYPGDRELNGYGAMFVVFWEGDVGCMGGNGTVVPNFTVVSHGGFSSADPVVLTDYKFPELAMVNLTSFTGKDGLLMIKGVTYGPKDQQGWPKKPVAYTLKLVDGKFVKQ